MKTKLVNAEELLEELFEEKSRPTVRWLREQTRNRTIPYTRIGRLVFFDVDLVREALEERSLKRMAKGPGYGAK